jgi:hypothetical protein
VVRPSEKSLTAGPLRTATRAIFELERHRIELDDPIRKYWRSNHERLNRPFANREAIDVERRKLEFVVFANGVVYFERATGNVFELQRASQKKNGLSLRFSFLRFLS